VTYDPATKTGIFAPSGLLEADTWYKARINTDAEDISGNNLEIDCEWTFTTGTVPDNTPPSVSSVNPVNGAVNASRSADIEIVFSESMDTSTMKAANIMIRDPGNNTISGELTYNTGNKKAVFNPASDLVYNTLYTVTVTTDVKDLAGNNMASQFDSSFRTEPDTTPPTVTSTLPADGATNVALGTKITAVFSESMDPATVNDTTFLIDGGTVAGTVTYSEADKKATFTPSSPLSADQYHSASITTGAKDLAGNGLAAVCLWSFTTTDNVAPSVSSTSPANNGTGQSVKAGITVTFNDDMNPATINSSTFRINNGAVTGSVSYDNGTKTATFTPTDNLNYATVYTVSLTTGIEDTSGNHMSANYSFSFTTKDRHWTIMVYADADNNLEPYILNDVAEMKLGYVDDQGVDVIVIMDRISGYSSDTSVFGQDFTDTRMYRITNGRAVRIGGGTQYPEITTSSSHEANMGSAATLRKFIRSCKNQFPAAHYAMILSNHGGGARFRAESTVSRTSAVKGSGTETEASGPKKAICWDDTSGSDALYTAEITDTLSAADSVDLLGLDACLMGSIEYAYQFRPGNGGFNAQVMVASPPSEWGNGWAYTNILERIKSGGGDNGTTDSMMGGNELYYDPASMTALQLGGIITEEQHDSTSSDSTQALSCYDLSQAGAVKAAVDALARILASESKKTDFENIRGNCPSTNVIRYFNSSSEDEWIFFPFFDLYDLCKKTSEDSAHFSATVRVNAAAVMSAVDAMVVNSFANSSYAGFENGKNGVHIFFPDGDTLDSLYGYRHWAYQWWYNSIDTNVWWPGGHYYGKLAWCIDGQDPAIGVVGNWLELLDSWFDYNNDPDGCSNGFRW